MNRLARFLITLCPNDYRKLILQVFPDVPSTPEIIRRFRQSVYENATAYDYINISDPFYWLEDQAANYFDSKRRVYADPNKQRQPGRHIERPGKISKKRCQVVT